MPQKTMQKQQSFDRLRDAVALVVLVLTAYLAFWGFGSDWPLLGQLGFVVMSSGLAGSLAESAARGFAKGYREQRPRTTNSPR